MKSILTDLYDHFYQKPKDASEEKRILANHQLLIQRLSKRNRKLVLRIIDDKDQICEDASLDSFIQGFRLGAMLASEMLNKNDGILRFNIID